MTARILSFRSGHAVPPGHLDVLAEVIVRDGCRCAHCRAPGGAVVQYGAMGHRDVYVVLDTLEAYDAVSGEAQGVVPVDAVPIWGAVRIVLDVAFKDHDHRNVGKRGRHPNVMLLCQRCAERYADEALYQRWAR
jgi:hypothetical protein